MRSLGKGDAYQPGSECWFAGRGYQVMRNITFASEFAARRDSDWQVIFAFPESLYPESRGDVTAVVDLLRGGEQSSRPRPASPAGKVVYRWCVKNPTPSSPEVSRRMRDVKTRDTGIEVALRSLLHRRGLRFRVDSAVAGVTKGRPDILFPTEKVAVFVDGCFWHGCSQHGSMPNVNRVWWEEKIAATQRRDRRHDAELQEAGWYVIRVWEHEDLVEAGRVIERAVLTRRRSPD